jgi:hypothetical protein
LGRKAQAEFFAAPAAIRPAAAQAGCDEAGAGLRANRGDARASQETSSAETADAPGRAWGLARLGWFLSRGLVMAGSRRFAARGMGECRQDNFGLAKRGLGAGLRGRSRVHARREACAGCRRAFERGSHALDRFVSSVSRAYLKSKDTRLSSIVLFCEAVGKANFLTIVEKLTAKEVVTVLSRVNPRHASKARANPAWARMRLAAVSPEKKFRPCRTLQDEEAA